MKQLLHSSEKTLSFTQQVIILLKDGCKAIKQEELDTVFIDMLEDIYISPAEIEVMKNEARELLQAIKYYENSLESPFEIQNKIETIKLRIQKSYSDKLDGKLGIRTQSIRNKAHRKNGKEQNFI